MTNQLMLYELPRETVNISENHFGKDMLSILNYTQLENTLRDIGTQNFDGTVINNIDDEKLQKLVYENMGEAFKYDLAGKDVPIGVKTSFSLAILKTKIIEYLTNLETVEVYSSPDIKEVFNKHGIHIPEGLSEINYNSLHPYIKSELVMPILNDLIKAEYVARAKPIFPDGIEERKYLLFKNFENPQLSILDILSHDYEDSSKKIYFNNIDNLDFQATVAKLCIKNHSLIKLPFDDIVNELKEMYEREKKLRKPKKMLETHLTEHLKTPHVKYDKGTTFFDIFPFKDSETESDLLKVFKMMYGDAYMTEGYGDEKIQLFLEQDSTLRLRYIFSDKYSSFLTVPYIELNALTECIDPEIFRPLGDGHNLISIDEYRSRSIIDLIGELITELDLRGDAMKIANVRHNRASFTIEKEIFDFLKGKKPDRQQGNETVEIDNVQKTHLDNNRHNTERKSFDYWLESSNYLLTEFKDVFIKSSDLFEVLGISPTGDKAAVKKAYYEIVKKTHEAKISHLSQEEQQAAEEKFKKSAKAYNNILSHIDNNNINTLPSICNLGQISQLFKEENF